MKFAISKSGFSLESLKKILPKKSKAQAVSTPQTVLACDFGKTKIVLAEFEKIQNRIKLTKFQKFQRPPELQKDAEALAQGFESGRYTTSKVRISVKGQGVILRFIQFPLMKPQELRSAISFEVDQYIPFKAHEVVWDFHIIEDNITLNAGGTGMNVLLVAVKRDDLYEMIQTFQSAGLQIEMIDVDALTSINSMEFFHPEDFKNPTALVDIGTEIYTLSIIQNGKPRFIRDISFGGFDILKRLKRKLGLSQEKAMEQIEIDRAPTPEAAVLLKEGLGDFVSDLKVSLNYYLDQIPSAEPVKKLFLCGGVGYQPIALQTLTENFGFPVENMNILTKIETGVEVDVELLKKNQGLLPITLGLALRP